MSAVEFWQRVRVSSLELRRRLPLAVTYLGSSLSLVSASIMQLVTMAILARTLGVAQFGQFLTMMALSGVAVHFVGLGAAEPLVRRVAREPSIYPTALGHNLILIAASGFIISALLVAVVPFWVTVSPNNTANLVHIAIFAIANTLLLRVVLLVEQVFIAHLDFTRANLVNLTLAATRLVTAVLACYVVGVSRLGDWLIWQAVGITLLAIAAYFVLRPMGRPNWRLMREELAQGFYFCTASAVRTLKQTGDIMVLGLVASPEIVGSFGLSRRIVETSGLTLDALFRITYPRLAKAMEPGLAAGLGLAKRILVAVVGIAILTAVALYIVAPLAPVLFGHQFDGVVPYLRLMCWVLIAAAFTGTGSEVLGASTRHGMRAALYYCTGLGVLFIGLMTYIFSVPGTIFALYLVEAALAAGFWFAILRLTKAEKESVEPGQGSQSGGTRPNDGTGSQLADR